MILRKPKHTTLLLFCFVKKRKEKRDKYERNKKREKKESMKK